MDFIGENKSKRLFSDILDAYDILTGKGERKPYSTLFIHRDGKVKLKYHSKLDNQQFKHIWDNINFDWNDKLLVCILENCFSKNKFVWQKQTTN